MFKEIKFWIKKFYINQQTKKISKKNVINTFLLIFFIAYIFFTFTAKPGDLFFTAKTIQENFRFKITPTQRAKASYSTSILKNRYKSFTKLSNKNNCLQALIAEDQTIFHLQNSYQKINTIEANQNLLETLKKIFSNKSFLETKCPVKSYISYIEYVIDFLIDANNSKLPTNKIDELKKQLDKLVIDIQSISGLNQEQITFNSQILLYLKNNFEVINTTFANNQKNESYKIIFINSLLLNSFEDSFNIEVMEDSTYAICTLVQNNNCNSNTLQSTWNSIKQMDDSLAQIEQSTAIVKDYLDLLVSTNAN